MSETYTGTNTIEQFKGCFTFIVLIIFIICAVIGYKIYQNENSITYFDCTFYEGPKLSCSYKTRPTKITWNDTIAFNQKQNKLYSTLRKKIDKYKILDESIEITNKNIGNIKNDTYNIDRITGNIEGSYIKDGKLIYYYGTAQNISK